MSVWEHVMVGQAMEAVISVPWHQQHNTRTYTSLRFSIVLENSGLLSSDAHLNWTHDEIYTKLRRYVVAWNAIKFHLHSRSEACVLPSVFRVMILFFPLFSLHEVMMSLCCNTDQTNPSAIIPTMLLIDELWLMRSLLVGPDILTRQFGNIPEIMPDISGPCNIMTGMCSAVCDCDCYILSIRSELLTRFRRGI